MLTPPPPPMVTQGVSPCCSFDKSLLDKTTVSWIKRSSKNNATNEIIDARNQQRFPRGLLPHRSYIGMYRPKRAFEPLGRKTGIDFAQYDLKSGMVFKGTARAYKRICLFNSKLIREKEKSEPEYIIRAVSSRSYVNLQHYRWRSFAYFTSTEF